METAHHGRRAQAGLAPSGSPSSCPFFPYARQDKKHRGREPISARLMADLFKTAGADRHDGRRPAHRADPGLLRRARRPPLRAAAAGLLRQPAGRPLARSRSCRPDAGRLRLAERWSETIGGAPLAFIHKTRDPDRPNEAKANRVVGDVDGRVCILQDDMIDTGGTITQGRRRALRRRRGRRHRRRDPRDLLRPGRRPAEELPASARSWSPTRCRSATEKPLRQAHRAARSRRCSPAASARSSTTAR